MSVLPVTGGEVAALHALTTGDQDRARAELAARVDRPLLGAALAEHLAGDPGGRVYDSPAAFTAFVDGGGNVGLYDALSTALADRYRVGSLLDLGCGDGRVVAAALVRAGTSPAVTLVEPSRPLLDAALAALAGHSGPVHGLHTDAAAFAATLPGPRRGSPSGARFALAESTFALHALPPAERSAVLTALRPHVDRLVLAEFDVPDHPFASHAHLEFLADTYERGLGEYGADRDLVAQGFLLPVLTGQLAPGAPRSTWEQPAAAWVAQLESCGYREVTTEPLFDYWCSPAFLLSAGT